jgi:hypothetical protein
MLNKDLKCNFPCTDINKDRIVPRENDCGRYFEGPGLYQKSIINPCLLAILHQSLPTVSPALVIERRTGRPACHRTGTRTAGRGLR